MGVMHLSGVCGVCGCEGGSSITVYSIKCPVAPHKYDVVVHTYALALYAKVTTRNSVTHHHAQSGKSSIYHEYLDGFPARDVRSDCYGGVQFQVCDSFLRPPRVDEGSWGSLSEVK